MPRCKVPRCEVKMLMQQRHLIHAVCCACLETEERPRDRDNGVENMCVPVTLQYNSGEEDPGVMITKVRVRHSCVEQAWVEQASSKREMGFVVCSLFSNGRSAPPSPGRFDCTAQLLRARGTLTAAAKRGTLTAMGPRPLAVNVSALHQAHGGLGPDLGGVFAWAGYKRCPPSYSSPRCWVSAGYCLVAKLIAACCGAVDAGPGALTRSGLPFFVPALSVPALSVPVLSVCALSVLSLCLVDSGRRR